MSFGFDFGFPGLSGFGFGGGGGLGGANLGVPSVFGIGSSLQIDPVTSVAQTLAAIAAQQLERGEVSQPTGVVPVDPAIATPVTIEETTGFPVDPPLNGDVGVGGFGGGFGTGPGLPSGVLEVGDLLASIDRASTAVRTTLGGFLNVGVIDDIADLTVAIGGIGRGVLGSPGNIVIDQALGLTGPRPTTGFPSRGVDNDFFEGGRFGFGPLGDLAIGLARQTLFPEPDAPRQQAGISDLFGILPEALRQPGATRALPGFIGEAADFLSGLFTGGQETMACGPVVPVAPRAGFPPRVIIPFQDQFGRQKVKFYQDMGQPLLFTKERAITRKWNRVVGPARQVRIARTGKRRRR